MIPELGHYALILALASSLVLGVVPLVGAWRRDATMMALARPVTGSVFVLIALAFVCLAATFVLNDFSVELVASHSNLSLPLPYRIAATWGSHEGSMLLWVLMLSGWACAVAARAGTLTATLNARVLGLMGLMLAGFLLFLLFTSNPFARLLQVPPDGGDLNPLLQDPGMVFHPPLLYMGYVGFSVPFAFAAAGLMEGRFDAAWARWVRPWTTLAWCFLTVGICLGSFWAYYELGWGGWWFWDPVENASFMPWLAGTALIHSLAVTEKRGSFRSWTVLLAILAFSLSLVGTFLVRSGVLTSVHAFATDPTRGVFILGYLALVIGGSLVLYAWRAPRVGIGPGFAPISRESMLLANNILLVVALAAVFLGTLYPLIIDTLNLGKLSVGPPYFEAVFYPLMAPALFLMGIGPLARWRQTSLPDLARRLRWAFAIAVVAALLMPLTVGGFRPWTSLGLLFGFWIIASTAANLIEPLRDRSSGVDTRRGSAGIDLRRARLLPASVWGMHLAHVGIAVFVIGVTLVKSYEIDVESRIDAGKTIQLAEYSLRFDRQQQIAGPNYDGVRATFELSKNGSSLGWLAPEKRRYRASQQTMTEAAIDRGLTRDVYLAMGEPLGDNAWAVRLQVKPFVDWIWAGCLLMAAGGFVAVSDKRYRRRRLESQAVKPLDTARPATVARS